ncbi:unnamed protein product [Closterium sp. Naga37s-1]|nr:unnamed protein product [Closterium sp. Naga37s-1]
MADDVQSNLKQWVAPLVESGGVASFEYPLLDAPDDLLLRLSEFSPGLYPSNQTCMQVAPLVASGDVAAFKDPHLDAPDDLLLRLARLALTCTAMPTASRPTMARVLGDLLGMKEEVLGGAEAYRAACRIDREIGSSAAHTVDFDAQLAGIEQMGAHSNLSGDA